MKKLRLDTTKKVYDLNSIFPINGRYKGEQLKRIPTSYLCWIKKQAWARKAYNNVIVWIEEYVEACNDKSFNEQ
jgi:uncharacterized protein (DUF3820 family)